MKGAPLVGMAVAALLLALPAVSAETGTADLQVALPGYAQGTARAASDQASLLHDDAAGEARLVLTAPTLTVAEVEAWTWTPLKDTPLDEQSELEVFGDYRVTERLLEDVTLTLVERHAGYALLAWNQGAAAVSTHRPPLDPVNISWDRDADLEVYALTEPFRFEDGNQGSDRIQASVLGKPVPFEHEVPAGRLTLLSYQSTTNLHGELGAYLSSATIRLDHTDGVKDLVLGSTYEERPGSIYLPTQGWTGPGTHMERIDRYLQIQAPQGLLALETDDSRSALHVPETALTLDGTLTFASARGTVTVANTTHTVDAPEFLLGGTYDAAIAPSRDADGTATMTAQGDLTYLAAGVQEQTWRASTLATAATLTGFALILGALAYFWGNLKAFLLGLLVPLYARVEGKQVLQHEGRQTVYDLIRHEPGVSASELAQKVDFGWSALVYHLKVLERNDLVVSLRDGRYKRFFDKTTGLYANGRKLVVSVLRNETSAALADLVRNEPGITQKQAAARLNIAPSSVHWHAKRLQEAGLLSKARRGAHIAYQPGEAWPKVAQMGLATPDAAPA